MLTSETIYVDGVPVGRIVIETQSQEIAFLPTISPSKLPTQDFSSLDDLRNAVISAYSKRGVCGAGTG